MIPELGALTNAARRPASAYTWAELHMTPRNPSARWTSALARRVAGDLAPDCAEQFHHRARVAVWRTGSCGMVRKFAAAIIVGTAGIATHAEVSRMASSGRPDLGQGGLPGFEST
jgi:ribosomal protein L37AE/L43A